MKLNAYQAARLRLAQKMAAAAGGPSDLRALFVLAAVLWSIVIAATWGLT